uniref:synaptic vesicular amine transporter-like n=1 Tax=Styela clava TaxID=7725 RepID=UPI00193AD962|nr:synaptic vesicular amine transporter-like [Styela clava]
MEHHGLKTRMKESFDKFRHSNRLAVFIVHATLMIDYILLTCVVPILPEYLFHENTDVHLPNGEIDSTTSLDDVRPTESHSTQTRIDFGNYTKTLGCRESRSKDILEKENLFLGFLLASKPFTEAIANVAVGPLTDRIGYDVPMFAGYIIYIFSSITFAFGTTYAVLFFARALQGVGSALATTSGLAMLASRFPNDEERGKMIGIALGGLALGVLIGPSFGSLTYEMAGKSTPFLVLAAASFLIGFLQLCSRQLQIQNATQHKALDLCNSKTLKDPYILLAASAIVFGNLSIAVIETGLPTWMMTTMCAKKWMLGVAALPSSISYLLTTTIVPRVFGVDKRWLICFVGYFLAALGSVLYPQSKTFFHLFGPATLIGT